ncbi:mechanosensitive ion channel family protein [Desulfosediminicola sp.]|uniref:mechanosensitive ion channel family protein n=1 Tax=Desulfosediminicola sp. TaxID=2886825 RepID=UPI003AF290C8
MNTLQWLSSALISLKLNEALAISLATAIMLGCALLAAFVATWLVKKTILAAVSRWISNKRYRWSDPLAKNRLLDKFSWFVPVAIFSVAVDAFLDASSPAYALARRLIMSGFVVIAVICLISIFSCINDIHRILRKHKGSTLGGYTDAGKIITVIVGAIFIVSIFTGKSPWGIISVLGGLTAVTMLVFKDTILGFVASVQLTSTDMVRIGDWVEMQQYGADGDVIDMGINCIRVQNWDKTVTTIPTYALVSSSFKNWRGMSESGGRRIKRALNIDISSIHFIDDASLQKLRKVTLLSDYLSAKDTEITEFNNCSTGTEETSLNSRRQTNIGVFRAYVIAYLRNNPNIHKDMTFLVRHLAPTDTGLPLEIYVFSKDQAWASYEAIQADIFDHLLAAVPEFGLRIFQAPSGHDLRSINSRSNELVN